MTGINKLRTAQKARTRSMPKQEGQEFLDMYLQQKRQERHERECENMQARSEFMEWDKKLMLKDMWKVQQKLSEVMDAALPEEVGKPAAGKAKNKAKKLPRSMKKMDLSY